LNGLSSESNIVLREDCLKFLREEQYTGHKYDVIVIDPPTLSRSKKMEGLFDIQQDYPELLLQARRLLAPEGIIYFSNNARRFEFDPALLPGLNAIEITAKTIPLDFHQEKIHRCWKIY
jgi:23S rRNA G2069 N7-methylase RlmK/C1962 C5-methylase RlmI